jgi:hypothetical protein
MTRRICVFCGSSPGARPSYGEAAAALGRYIASSGISLVYGGAKAGLMGILADAALQAGGEVIGVMPRALVEKEISHPGLTELRVVGSMHERKAQMADLADAFLALPGGFGTFEEFCEVVTWTQLGLHRKPCGLLNIDGFYDQFLAFFDHAVEEKFIKPRNRRIVLSDSVPESLVDRLLAHEAPPTEKWIDRKET